MRAYNFGHRAINLTKLFQVTCREVGMIKRVPFFGGPAPLKFGSAKTVRIWCDFAQLHTSIAIISGRDNDIDKGKTALSPALPSTYGKKNLVKFGPQTKKL